MSDDEWDDGASPAMKARAKESAPEGTKSFEINGRSSGSFARGSRGGFSRGGGRGESTGRGRILKTAAPSQNLPSSTVTKKELDSTSAQTLAKRNEESSNACDQMYSSEADLQVEEQIAESVKLSLNSNKDISETDLTDILANLNQIGVRDVEVQVNTYQIATLCNLLNTDKALRCFTGLDSLQILNCLEETTRKVFDDSRSHRLSIRERIVLTMTKLKLDLSYGTLAALFGISAQLCKNYFFDMLDVLSVILKTTIYFPSREEISRNMPKCFQNFSTCRVVLDCTEIVVQKPSCLCCRIRFYSQCKGDTTIKFMTGVAPAGLITFVSKSYGGRASDKLIFEESDLINKLCPNKDSIMVDKGLLIDDICALHKITLIRPPFLRNKQQLSADETLLDQQIAAARVHIEKLNQKIKKFKIISGKLQWLLVPKINEILNIIYGLTNLAPPILSDEEF